VNVAVVDYGLGNIYSVMAALREVGVSAVLDTDGTKIRKCDAALVPGVAAFGAGMRSLLKSGQAESLTKHFSSGNRLIGLCLGAQMFMDRSEESPEISGLGFVTGQVVRLNERNCTVPNQGWCKVVVAESAQEGDLRALQTDRYYYFSHSFRMATGKSVSILGTTQSGEETIVAAYQIDNVVGVQFHPERSGADGLEFLAAIMRS
jgi:glutamine amidotransferase